MSGTRIDYKDEAIVVPDDPIIPFIEGDGTDPDIWRATQYVIDGTVAKVYGGKKTIVWKEVYAGDKAKEKFDDYLPQTTLDEIAHYRVAVANKPADFDFRYNLGNACFAAKRYDEAAANLLEAVRINPNSAAARDDSRASPLPSGTMRAGHLAGRSSRLPRRSKLGLQPPSGRT